MKYLAALILVLYASMVVAKDNTTTTTTTTTTTKPKNTTTTTTTTTTTKPANTTTTTTPKPTTTTPPDAHKCYNCGDFWKGDTCESVKNMTVRTCDMYGSDKVPNPLKGCVTVHYATEIAGMANLTMTWMDCASMLGQAGIKPPEDWHLTGKLNEGCLDMELGILGYEGRVTGCVCDGDNCNDNCISKCKAAKGNGAGAVKATAAATLIAAVMARVVAA